MNNKKLYFFFFFLFIFQFLSANTLCAQEIQIFQSITGEIQLLQKKVGVMPRESGKRSQRLKKGQDFSKLAEIKVDETIRLRPFDDLEFSTIVEKVSKNISGDMVISARIKDFPLGQAVTTKYKGRTMTVLKIPENNQIITITQDSPASDFYSAEIDPQNILEGSPSLIPPDNSLSSPQKAPASPHSKDDGKAPDSPDNVVDIDPADDMVNDISLAPNFHNDGQPLILEGPSENDMAEIDLMILYTPAALNWANANGGIENVIAQSVLSGRTVLENSKVGIDLNLVYSGLINYTESAEPSTDLSRLTYDNDGFMDTVHQLRNDYGADLVCLFEKTEATGGLGWLLDNTNGLPGYAFCLVRVQQAAYTFTMIHELGHNMGLGHHKNQNVQPGPGLFPYSAGWRWTGNDNGKYCDIMTYENGSYFSNGVTHTRVPYFSNPQVKHKGVPTGHATNGDGAKTLRKIKHIVASYRSGGGSSIRPNNLVARWDNGLFALEWTNPNDNAFSGTMIRYSMVDFPRNRNEGNLLIKKGGTKASLDTASLKSKKNNAYYFFSAWSYFSDNSYSQNPTTFIGFSGKTNREEVDKEIYDIKTGKHKDELLNKLDIYFLQ